ncbi:DNA polymerase IV [Hoyosella rhizosphaerae]|uniref:DNA polymerase IV n=2 Tax=Hoyosella rhizosphaerae TaxID=1755582 RepID=A0A916U1T1_9ACTN|nr:DNA polymerase IV [Hoyosella rhizosphaerae]MBN4926658.1 DNA polymerase IV [Hoyosella rhizosphaerae]GGC57507.1 DNA polymerase IV [Hoyosella rhizosphaerae]
MESRWVVHLDMDAFFASVEQLARPTLRGRPVLVGGIGGRGVVAGASYEARTFGAKSAMPMHQAQRLIGVTAVVVPPRGSVYRAASERTFAAVRELMPVIEQLSFDEAFGEPPSLKGAARQEVEEFCKELRAQVYNSTGLNASVGAGSGKQIAKIASALAKPAGQLVVGHAEQSELLAPLPVRKLWGIGPVADQRLRTMGVTTIGQFAALSVADAASILGTTTGPALHALAQGIDTRAVTERAVAKQISAETTFAQDLLTKAQVRAAIARTGNSAHARLLKDTRGARTVTVKLRKADFSIVSRSATLPYATTDRGVLIATAHKLAADPIDVGPIRLVGVSLSGLTSTQQQVLFPELDVDSEPVGESTANLPTRSWSGISTGSDVQHVQYGFGWVQGCGHGVVTVRFETRSTGPGKARTFALDDENLTLADPLLSLDWPRSRLPD